MDKQALRAEIRAEKRAMTPAQIEAASDRLAELLFAHPAYQAAKSLYGYLSYNQEVRTAKILQQAQKDGKRVAVPKVFGDEMRFLWLDDLSAVAPGAYNIPEPVADTPVADDETALVLMPGLAFDPDGHRCGYGGGFYDKYLAAHRQHVTLALCYDFQMFAHLDVDDYDIPVRAVRTGRGGRGMNKYVFVLIVCAVVFLVCFLIDSLLKLLFPKSRLEKSKQVVRPPRRSAVIGVILTFAGAAMLVKLLPEKGDVLFIIGSIVAVIFGVILLCTYFSFVIYYDDEGFLYKAWGHGKQEFRYSQIRGQRSLLTRGGVNTILFVGEEEINLYSAMQNLNAFLSKAFFKWCAAKGIDPDSVENNPRMATYFPDPDPAKPQDGGQ